MAQVSPVQVENSQNWKLNKWLLFSLIKLCFLVGLFVTQQALTDIPLDLQKSSWILTLKFSFYLLLSHSNEFLLLI